MSRQEHPHFPSLPSGRRDAGNGPVSAQDYRDLVIEALAGNEAAQVDRIVDLSVERDQYQECFKTALHALAEITRERNQLRRRYRALLEARRRDGVR